MRTTPIALLALTVALAAACAPKVNDPADVQAVKDTAPAYDKFANAGDAASLAAEFYGPTESAWIRPSRPLWARPPSARRSRSLRTVDGERPQRD